HTMQTPSSPDTATPLASTSELSTDAGASAAQSDSPPADAPHTSSPHASSPHASSPHASSPHASSPQASTQLPPPAADEARITAGVEVDDLQVLHGLTGPGSAMLRDVAKYGGAEVGLRGNVILISGFESRVRAVHRFLTEAVELV